MFGRRCPPEVRGRRKKTDAKTVQHGWDALRNNTDGPEAVPGGPTGSGPQQPKTPKSPPYPFPPTCSTSGSSDSPGWSSWGRFLGRPILPRAGADAASNQWGTTAMVPQQHPARAPPRRDCSPNSSTVHRPDTQSRPLGVVAASGAAWRPSMVRVCRLSHSLGSTLAPMAAGPARFPDCWRRHRGGRSGEDHETPPDRETLN